MTSRRCSLPSKTAWRSDWSRSPDGRVVVQVLEGGDDDLAGDVAGRVAAHAVGDGEQPGPGVDRVLVVAADEAAVGSRAIPEDERHETQLQGGLADADRLAGVDQQRTLDALLVEVGAVGGAEVLDVPLAAAVGQAGVARAGEVVGQDERRVVGAADEDRLVAQGDLGAGERAGGDDQGARALLSALAGRGRRPGRHGGHPADASTEQVGPHDAERGEDEQPQQQQETEAEPLKHDLWHQPSPLSFATRARGCPA